MARAVVTIDNEGRICLPQPLRDALRWEEGTLLKAEVSDSGHLLLHPIEEEPLLVEKDGVLVVRSSSSAEIEKDLEALRSERLIGLSGATQ